MKALLILLAVVLVLALAHPVLAGVVIVAELALCGALGALIWRAVRPLHRGRHRRTA